MTKRWTIRLLSVRGNSDGELRTCFMVERRGEALFRFKPSGLPSGGGSFDADGDGRVAANHWLDTTEGRDMMLAANAAHLAIERMLKRAKIDLVKTEWDGTVIPSEVIS